MWASGGDTSLATNRFSRCGNQFRIICFSMLALSMVKRPSDLGIRWERRQSAIEVHHQDERERTKEQSRIVPVAREIRQLYVPGLNQKIRTPQQAANPLQRAGRNSGLVIYLFLLSDHLPHADLWRIFFASDPANGKSGHRIFAHCTLREACLRNSAAFEMLHISLIPWVPSKYCYNVISVQWALLGAAMRRVKDHAGPLKFVFVSGTTVPIRSLSEVRKVLLKTDDSDWCFNIKHHQPYFYVQSGFGIVRHSQWVILNRQDALRSLRAASLKQGPFGWKLPRMGSNGVANFSDILLMNTARLQRGCLDEQHANFVFGMYEDKMKHLYPKSTETCRTAVFFGKNKSSHPGVFNGGEPQVGQLLRKPYSALFLRKFGENANLTEIVKRIRGF